MRLSGVCTVCGWQLQRSIELSDCCLLTALLRGKDNTAPFWRPGWSSHPCTARSIDHSTSSQEFTQQRTHTCTPLWDNISAFLYKMKAWWITQLPCASAVLFNSSSISTVLQPMPSKSGGYSVWEVKGPTVTHSFCSSTLLPHYTNISPPLTAHIAWQGDSHDIIR